MGTSKRGKASLLFEDPPLILSAASVVGKKEGEGPLGKYFDRIEMDSMLGKRTWEEAESELQTRTARPVSYTHLGPLRHHGHGEGDGRGLDHLNACLLYTSRCV